MITTPKICIFCGRSAPIVRMSNEHVVRKKLHAVLPEAESHSRVSVLADMDDASNFEYTDRTIEQPLLEQTINRVCKQCNEGWLNYEVEKTAERALERLVLGKSASLNRSDCRKVATWATKTTMVRGVKDIPKQHLPRQGYRYLMRHLRPPPGVEVWAGLQPWSNGTWNTYTHAFLKFEDGHMDLHELLALSIGCLHLITHIHHEVTRTLPYIDLEQEEAIEVTTSLKNSKFVQIWPYKERVTWRPKDALTREEAKESAELLRNALNKITLPNGTPFTFPPIVREGPTKTGN